MRHQARHSNREDQNSTNESVTSGAREFASPEEMLRHDAANTEVPAAVAERLQRSLAANHSPAVAWWKRLFGKSA